MNGRREQIVFTVLFTLCFYGVLFVLQQILGTFLTPSPSPGLQGFLSVLFGKFGLISKIWLVVFAVMAVGSALIGFVDWTPLSDGEDNGVVRGRKRDSKAFLDRAASFVSGPSALVGFVPQRKEELTKHSLIVGATGSGKTLSVKAYIRSLLLYQGASERYVVYDAKTELVPFLACHAGAQPLFILNPFDKRSVAWDMAKDIKNPASALQAANILVPKNPNVTQPFFDDATRHLLSGVMTSFLLRLGEDWSLADICLTFKTEARVKAVLKACPDTEDLYERYFSNEKTGGNIISSAAAHLGEFDFIAAAWQRAESKISLSEFIEADEGILILGNDEAQRTALDKMNQVIFKRLTELTLRKPEEGAGGTTHFVLDEIREAGKLDGLHQLLTKGRSKGAAVLIAFQDIEGMREVYGHQVANELTSQCGNKVFLRCSGKTAEWASEHFGDQEVIEYRTNTSSGTSSGSGSTDFIHHSSQKGKSKGESKVETIRTKKAVLPAEFADLPSPGPGELLQAFYDFSNLGIAKCQYDWPWVSEVSGIFVKSDEAALEFRPDEDQRLRRWDEEREALILGTEGNETGADSDLEAVLGRSPKFEH